MKTVLGLLGLLICLCLPGEVAAADDEEARL
jgi:hypothetical protein